MFARWINPAVSGRATSMLLVTILVLAGSCTAGQRAQPARPTVPSAAASPHAMVDPAATIQQLVGTMAPDGPYRDPDSDERRHARNAVRALLDKPEQSARHDEMLFELGFDSEHGTDPVSGRRVSVYATGTGDESGWGALVVDRAAPIRVLIAVPHPAFDLHTELLGLALLRAVPGSALLVAGAHRAAAGGRADVAHNDESLFHTLATEFAKNDIPQLQLHGYAVQNLPSAHAVVSTGTAAPGDLSRRVANALSAAGLPVCRAWAARCGQLEGTNNEQGRVAAEAGSTFIHLEFSLLVRADAEYRDAAASAIAGQLR